ncbi:MAG: 50S ribosomal protein L25 [Patescibacteria group bacterium]
MTINLAAKTRTLLGKKVDQLREAGKIPAVLYGHGVKNLNLELGYNEFEKIFKEAGESTIIDLSIDGGAPTKVLISDIQYEPVKNRISHVDFHQIRMDEKINAKVALNFIGESKAVKEDGGVMLHIISELEIRCLPKDLIHEIEVDISPLVDFNAVISVKDLNLPANLEVIGHELEEVVAKVAKPKAEEEPVAAPAEGETPAEGEAGGAKEGGEATEGAKAEKAEKKSEKGE